MINYLLEEKAMDNYFNDWTDQKDSATLNELTMITMIIMTINNDKS